MKKRKQFCFDFVHTKNYETETKIGIVLDKQNEHILDLLAFRASIYIHKKNKSDEQN